ISWSRTQLIFPINADGEMSTSTPPLRSSERSAYRCGRLFEIAADDRPKQLLEATDHKTEGSQGRSPVASFLVRSYGTAAAYEDLEHEPDPGPFQALGIESDASTGFIVPKGFRLVAQDEHSLREGPIEFWRAELGELPVTHRDNAPIPPY